MSARSPLVVDSKCLESAQKQVRSWSEAEHRLGTDYWCGEGEGARKHCHAHGLGFSRRNERRDIGGKPGNDSVQAVLRTAEIRKQVEPDGIRAECWLQGRCFAAGEHYLVM